MVIKDYYSLSEASEILGKSKETLRRWDREGKLSAVREPMSQYRIYKKEQIIENGQIVLLKLAPVDPRSLMQGDYMRLRFSIENTLLEKNEAESANQSTAYFVVNLDENAVGTFVRIDDDEALEDNQIKMQFRIRNAKIRLATHAFFFQEGSAEKYEKAQYGEFRVDAKGELLLNNLRDESFKVIGLNRPSN